MTRSPRQTTVPVVRRLGAEARPDHDEVVVEEPLEIRVGGDSLLVTMRTPGDDLDLARGLLFTEGFVRAPQDLVALAHCRDVPEEARGNVVVATLRAGAAPQASWSNRALLMGAGCGLCGKSTLAAIHQESAPVGAGPRLDGGVVSRLPEALRASQAVFQQTGGLHAAALFDATGRLLALKEDVGRHNAVDKVIGEAMRFGLLPLSQAILLLSGRAGFELVQKARRAGIPVVCSVSAPSSLAIELAREGGQTLIGFLRGDAFNVYTGAERLPG